MIRSHKPRGFLWNCATPFQQTVEFRDVRYEDCVAPVSAVLSGEDQDDDDDDGVAHIERAAKRRRIEELADDFLNGKPLEIPTARLSRFPYPVRRLAKHNDSILDTELSNTLYGAAAAFWVEERSDRDVIRAACHLAVGEESSVGVAQASPRGTTRVLHPRDSQSIGDAEAQAACRPQWRARNEPILANLPLKSAVHRPAIVGEVDARHAYDDDASIPATSFVEEPPPDVRDGLSARGEAGQPWLHIRKSPKPVDKPQSLLETSHNEASAEVVGVGDVATHGQTAPEQTKDAGNMRLEESLVGHGRPVSKSIEAASSKPKRRPDHHSRATDGVSSPFSYRVRTSDRTRNPKHEERRPSPVLKSPEVTGKEPVEPYPPEKEHFDGIKNSNIGNTPALPTPIGDRHLNMILPKDANPAGNTTSLKKSIRAEWRRSGADISLTSSAPAPSPLDEEPCISPAIPPSAPEVAGPPQDPVPAKPMQTPRTHDGTPGLLSKAKQNFFTSSRRRSTANLTQGETSSESPTTISSQPLPRRPLQQLPQESLPGTQTVLDGWRGFSTVRKPRSNLGKSRRGSYASPPGTDEPSIPMPKSLQPPQRTPSARTASSVGLGVGGHSVPRRATLEDDEMEMPSFTALSTGAAAATAAVADDGADSQVLLQSSRELIDEHFGDAVAFQAMLSR